MKKCLILVLSSDFAPYDQMILTSQSTWDSIDVPNTEIIYYCSLKDNNGTTNKDKTMYFDVNNTLFDIGYKNIEMFDWALKNKEFDYVLRVNASQYVDKKQAIEFAQTLPDTNLFSGPEVKDESRGKESWLWGGMGFWISRDVLQKFVDNKQQYDHSVMEDKSLSYLANRLGIPFSDKFKSCSIDHNGGGWKCLSYCGNSKDFTDFSEIKDLGHIVYRVKCDGKRWVDTMLMQELFKTLNQ